MRRDMDLGIADHGKRACREQAAQIAITLLADAAEFFSAPARMLLRHQPDPGREVAPRAKRLRVGDARDQSRGQGRTHSRNLIEPFARLMRAMPDHDLAIEVQYLRFQRPQLGTQSGDTRARYFRDPLVFCTGDDISDIDAKLEQLAVDPWCTPRRIEVL